MTRSARLLAAVIARAHGRTASMPPTTPATALGALLAAPPRELVSPGSPPAAACFPALPATSRRGDPSLPACLDWARSYAKAARGGGGGGKKGGGGGGGGGSKKGGRKRGGHNDDDEEEEEEGDDDDDAAEEAVDEDPVKLGEIEEMMKAAVEHYSHELAGVRTGRANPGLIENLQVPVSAPSEGGGSIGSSSGSGGGKGGSHGHAHVPLRALGTVTVRDPQTLAVSVYDPAMAGAVARAIQNSPLGLAAAPGGGGGDGGGGGGGSGSKNQASSEVLVRLPRMTREVVERMVKLVHAEGEGALLSIRRARQRALDAAKGAYGGGGGGGKGAAAKTKSSEWQRAEKDVQALVERYTSEVERLKRLKDKELREHRD